MLILGFESLSDDPIRWVSKVEKNRNSRLLSSPKGGLNFVNRFTGISVAYPPGYDRGAGSPLIRPLPATCRLRRRGGH